MGKHKQRYYVYVLARPDGRLFYVGKGQGDRVFDHDAIAKKGHRCHKCNVIRKIRRSGKQVQHYIVFTTDDEQEALDYEMTMIAMFGRDMLTNQSDGGEGMRNPTAEYRAKHSRAGKARWKDPAFRAKMDAIMQQRNNDPEWRRKIGEARVREWQDPEFRARQMKGRTDPLLHEQRSDWARKGWSDERRARVSERFARLRQRPEYIKRMSENAVQRELRRQQAPARRAANAIRQGALAKQMMQDPEFREKVRAGSRRKWQDPEFRAKISDLHATPEFKEKQRAAARDPERRAKLSAAKKAQWQDSVFRAKMVEANRRRWKDPELAPKLRAAAIANLQRRKPFTPPDPRQLPLPEPQNEQPD